MSNRAWVTLATNDSYGLGALVLAHSLRRAGSTYPSVVLITPSVTEAMRDRLRAVFADVVIVDVLDSKDATHLALLQRPELGITFTKIHCWNLTQYEKCVFLDADTLIVQNCDELFEREELSAAPDVGWPDCFNSGVFVFKPSAETFDSLVKFAQERGSFDGGDQGLLNSYFSDWAHGDINKHLPFLYNVTSAAFYSYIPALKHYGQNLKIIHFIGAAKPWLQQFNWETRTAEAPQHLREFLQLWWDIFVGHVHSQLEISMTGVAGNLARVVLGAGAQREALDDLTRRQGWEAGNIDYMGADAFDNIWAKISQTLSQPRSSPPKQSTPPPAATPAPEVAPPVEEKPAETPTPVEAPAPQAPVVEAPAPAIPLEASVPAEAPIEKPEAAKTEAPVEAAKPSESQAPVETPAPVEASAPVEAAAPVEAPAAPEPVKPTEPAVEIPAPEPAAAPAAVEPAKTVAAPAEEPKVATPAETPASPAVPVEAPATPSETKTQAPEAAAEPPKAISPPQSPVAAVPSKPEAPKPEVTPEKGASPTDSPPLANTPSKEEVPIVPAAKSTEEAAQETRL